MHTFRKKEKKSEMDAFSTRNVMISGENHTTAIKTFAAANLGPILTDNMTRSGYREPTLVQKHAIPMVAAGRDLIAWARTGSGKTAAYLLPIVNKLIENNNEAETGETMQAPKCVVITPTRELAIQTHNDARKFAEGSMVKSVVAYDDTCVGQLQKGCDILVTCPGPGPGKLPDLLEKGLVSFANCKYLVLDEANRMLEMGFMPEIEGMMEDPAMPKKAPEGNRQTLLFSSSSTDEIQERAQEFLTDYLCLAIQ